MIRTDLEVEPVRMERGADVGVERGRAAGGDDRARQRRRRGRGRDPRRPPLAVVAGVPAAILRYRREVTRPRKTGDG